MANHSNRGMDLEKTVLQLFKHYEQRGIWCHKLEVKQAEGNFIAKSPFDFLVFNDNTLYAFDTKHCKSGGMGVNNFKLHQIKALSDVESNGGKGFFLVYYADIKQLEIIPVAEMRQMQSDGIKTIHPDARRKTKLDFLGIL